MGVTLTGTGSTISGGAAGLTVTDLGTNSTIIGGTVAGSGELDVLEAGTGAFIAGELASSLKVTVTGSDSEILGGSGSLDVIVAGSGSSIVGGSGPMDVTVSEFGSLIYGATSEQMDIVDSGTGSTISGGTGGQATVYTSTNTLLVAGIDEALTLVGSSGSPSPTVFGAAGADVTYFSTVGSALFAAGSGNETLNAAGSTVPVTMFGGQDSTTGNDTLIGGAGNDELASITSNVTMTGGAGKNEFVVEAAGGSPRILITDYNSNDGVVFDGYSASDVNNAFVNAAVFGGNTTIALSDATHVTFEGVIDPATIQWLAIGGAPCFCSGTMIATLDGEVPIEALAIGEPVLAHDGTAKLIKWIGRRAYNGRLIAGNRDLLPIRIAANAIADGVPHHDLDVSPKHAMLIDGVLVPAELLVNGVSIWQLDTVDQLEYFHIELETHDVIFAEGASSETFMDCDNRGMFQNAEEFARLYPNDESRPWRFCAERLSERSPKLRVIRKRLAERAGINSVQSSAMIRALAVQQVLISVRRR